MQLQLIDKIDRSILNLLQTNALYSVKEIAGKVGLSVTPTYERIKRMEKNGYIEKYVALVDRFKIDRSLVVFCSVSLRDHSKKSLEKFNEAALSLDEVMEAYYTSGSYDFMLKIITEDMNSYQDFMINKLNIIDNIATVHSSFALKELKFETAFELKLE